MSRRSSSRRGLTLLELLIAMTLVSLLGGGIFMALRVGLNSMERSSGKLMQNRRVAGVRRIIDSQISGIIPVSGACNAGQATQHLKSVFFQGDAGSMRAVTSYSLNEAARGYPRLVEYLVIPGEDGIGVRLVVNELYYTGPSTLASLCTGIDFDGAGAGPVMRLVPVQATPNSFVLADKLAYCRLSYLRVNPMIRERVWLERWQGKGLPAAIRIEMKPLQPDPSRLQLATMTLPLYANRDPYKEYDDVEQPPQQQPQ